MTAAIVRHQLCVRELRGNVRGTEIEVGEVVLLEIGQKRQGGSASVPAQGSRGYIFPTWLPLILFE